MKTDSEVIVKLLEDLEGLERALFEMMKANEQYQSFLRDLGRLLDDWSRDAHPAK